MKTFTILFVYKEVHTVTPTFTVHGHSPFCAFTHMQEAPGDDIRGCRPIQEEQVMVLKSCILKPPAFIQLPVQTDHGPDVYEAKVCEVRLWCMEGITWENHEKHCDLSALMILRRIDPERIQLTVLYLTARVGAAECQNFPWNDPIHISVFYTLKTQTEQNERSV